MLSLEEVKEDEGILEADQVGLAVVGQASGLEAVVGADRQ